MQVIGLRFAALALLALVAGCANAATTAAPTTIDDFETRFAFYQQQVADYLEWQAYDDAYTEWEMDYEDKCSCICDNVDSNGQRIEFATCCSPTPGPDTCLNTREVCQNLTICTSSQYESVAPGATRDRECTDLITCGFDEYEMTAPTATSQRVCAALADCAAGEYEANAPANGIYFQPRQCLPVDGCASDEYQDRAPTATSNRVCMKITECTVREFELLAPTATSDRICKTYTQCQENEYRVQDATATSDRICEPLTVCDAQTEYEAVAARPNSDRICMPISDCAETQFVLIAATEMADRVCANYTMCNFDRQYEATVATATSDRICMDIESCAGDEYETAAPTMSSDRQCAILTECSADQYQMTAATATSDRVCAPIAGCAIDQYEVSAPTRTSDRVCASFTTCGTGEWESVAATASSDRVCAQCSTCAEGLHEAAACTSMSDTVCESCDSCESGVTFASTPCSVDENTVCSPCSTCTAGVTFQQQACFSTSDTICAPCSVCGANQYLVSACSVTRDTVCAAHTVCTDNEYEMQAPTATSDRICRTLTPCGSRAYESRPPTATSNRGCTLYRTCTTDEYESVAPTATSDRECSLLSSPCDSTAEYEIVPATATNDRECDVLRECSDNQYEKLAPSTTSDRICQNVKTCAATTQYERVAPTATSDRICGNYTICATGEFEVVAPTATSDRICRSSRTCASGEYEAEAATTSSDRVCETITTCSETQFELVAPTTTSDRICLDASDPCDFPTSFEAAPLTSTSDRICVPVKSCAAGEYETVAPTTTSDRECAQVEACPAGTYEVSAPTTSSDRVCISCGCSEFATCEARNGTITGVAASCGSLGASDDSNHQCVCMEGYAGDGFNCAVDSDYDGYPDDDIVACADSCMHCVGDVCPLNAYVHMLMTSDFTPIQDNVASFTHYYLDGETPIIPMEGEPSWSVSGTSTVDIAQSTGSLPSTLLAAPLFNAVAFEGTLRVDSDADDDFIGWVFGFRNDTSFYVAQWKRIDQSETSWDQFVGTSIQGAPQSYGRDNDRIYRAIGGLQIKRVNGPIADFALWSTNDLTEEDGANYNSVKLQYHDSNIVGWEPFTSYRFKQYVDPAASRFRVEIYAESDMTTPIVDSDWITVTDAESLRGRIGVFSFSQADSSWSDVTVSCRSSMLTIAQSSTHDDDDVCRLSFSSLLPQLHQIPCMTMRHLLPLLPPLLGSYPESPQIQVSPLAPLFDLLGLAAFSCVPFFFVLPAPLLQLCVPCIPHERGVYHSPFSIVQTVFASTLVSCFLLLCHLFVHLVCHAGAVGRAHMRGIVLETTPPPTPFLSSGSAPLAVTTAQCVASFIYASL